MSAVVDYIPRDSFLHKLNPLTKICWTLLILVIAIIFNHYLYMISLLAVILLTAVFGKVFREISRLFKGLIVFASIMFLMQVLFFDQGATLFHLIPVGPGYLRITDQGLLLSMSMAFRMLAILISFLVFLATTKIQDMVNVLVEKLKIPYDYAFMFLTSMRFIPTFMNEVRQISDAQKARGFVLEGWNPVKKMVAYLPISVPLVLLSLKKAQQLALAMVTRGYGAGVRTHLREVETGTADYMMILVMAGILACAIWVRLQGFGAM